MKYSNHDAVLKFGKDLLAQYISQIGNRCPNGSVTIPTNIQTSLDIIVRLGDKNDIANAKNMISNRFNEIYISNKYNTNLQYQNRVNQIYNIVDYSNIMYATPNF